MLQHHRRVGLHYKLMSDKIPNGTHTAKKSKQCLQDPLWLWPWREDRLIDPNECRPARFKQQGAPPHSILQSGKCTHPITVQRKMLMTNCWLVSCVVQKLIHPSLLHREIRNKACKHHKNRSARSIEDVKAANVLDPK